MPALTWCGQPGGWPPTARPSGGCLRAGNVWHARYPSSARTLSGVLVPGRLAPPASGARPWPSRQVMAAKEATRRSLASASHGGHPHVPPCQSALPTHEARSFTGEENPTVAATTEDSSWCVAQDRPADAEPARTVSPDSGGPLPRPTTAHSRAPSGSTDSSGRTMPGSCRR